MLAYAGATHRSRRGRTTGVAPAGDGKIWVPDRTSLENAQLLSVMAPSLEEQRLTDLYRKKGIHALVEDLKK